MDSAILRLMRAGFQHTAARRRLGTDFLAYALDRMFQHTAARRRLGIPRDDKLIAELVSTHSRPKAAGPHSVHFATSETVSTHSRPKAAGMVRSGHAWAYRVSTHSRPKAAGCRCPARNAGGRVSTHSRPKAAGRRGRGRCCSGAVSTHSRPKAAGTIDIHARGHTGSFNTQPPEGGWASRSNNRPIRRRFQHTAARRRLERLRPVGIFRIMFQHTAARRRLGYPFDNCQSWNWFQHTAARRRLGKLPVQVDIGYMVSTHSRPKAAGGGGVAGVVQGQFQHTAARRRLAYGRPNHRRVHKFQHTAARRRLGRGGAGLLARLAVSTHSRPKAAGWHLHLTAARTIPVSTHSRPKAAGGRCGCGTRR